jgi:hypothetical protein
MLTFRPLIVSLNNKRMLVKCDKHIKTIPENKDDDKQNIKYKELHDPEYFREDFYGLRKVVKSVPESESKSNEKNK